MKENIEKYQQLEPGSEELVELLVSEHHGWACSIARSVARAWNLDWQLDGLDGGAYEGLLFCARRYDPSMGVPFRAYARRRIHEASSEEARKSKNWQKGTSAAQDVDSDSREISSRLFEIFPSLRDGVLPVTQGDGEDSIRTAIRQLLSSASIIATFNDRDRNNPETLAEYKHMLDFITNLEPVHQHLLWEIYWQDKSMRGLAEDWGVDELVIIREHKEILHYVFSRLSETKRSPSKALRVRPGLRPIAQKLRKSKTESPFSQFGSSA